MFRDGGQRRNSLTYFASNLQLNRKVGQSAMDNVTLYPLRDWILTHCQILASIQLPREAFLPQVGVGTGILIMRRKSPGEIQPDYPIFMALAEQVGHDSRGKIQYRRSPEGDLAFIEEDIETLRWSDGDRVAVQVPLRRLEVWDDLPLIVQCFKDFVRQRYYEVFYTEDPNGAPRIETALPPDIFQTMPVTKEDNLLIEPHDPMGDLALYELAAMVL